MEKERNKGRERERECVVGLERVEQAGSFLAFLRETGAGPSTGSFDVIDIICYH